MSEEDGKDVESGQSIDIKDYLRDAKFLLYYRSTTIIATTTLYSGTSTFATLLCTPSGFTINACGCCG